MNVKPGNHSFAALVTFAATTYIALSVAACALLSLLGYRLAVDGVAPIDDVGWAMAAALLFLAIVAAGGVVGVVALYRQVVASRRLGLRLDGLQLPVPPTVRAAATNAGLSIGLRYVDCEDAFSFAYGAIRPRVAVSRGLVERATPTELEAVLVHENYHVRNRDPLKVVLTRTLVQGLYYLPIMRGLENGYLAGRELAADRRALERCGRSPLAGALFKVVRGPSWPELSAAAAIGGPELLAARIDQLETGVEPPLAGLTRGAIALSVLGALLLSVSFVASIAGLGGAEAIGDMPAMEGRLDGSVWSVLMVAGCILPWLVAGWIGWAWLRVRR